MLAAGLGQLVASAEDVPPGSARWLLYGGMAAYFGLGALTVVRGAFSGKGLFRLALWLLSGVVVPLLLATFADGLIGVVLAWYGAFVALLHYRFGVRDGAGTTAQP